MRYLLLSVLVVCVIGVMVPSAFGGHLDMFGRDTTLNECHNHAQFLEDLDKCNQEAQNRRMMEAIGPLIIPLLFLVCVFVIALSWFAFRRSRKPVIVYQLNQLFCQNCRTVLRPTAKFCAKCGIRRF